jgi:tRNA 2-selenouridine synthase
MTWRELTPEQLLTFKDPLVIDVRSPGEHESERVLGSVNVPLLDNDERAVVGTCYVQEGEAKARLLALDIISPKLPKLIRTIIAKRKQGQAVVVYCWRGGLRSESVCSFLSIIGIDSWRLKGGYKAWRRMVIDDLAKADYKFKPLILQGLTGVGKTELLLELEKLGVSVLDLEGIANHRGSVFGGMGLGEQPTQKNFDAALWDKLRSFGDETVVLEAESRNIGKLAVPDFILAHIADGKKVLVTASIEMRAQRLVADYIRVDDQATRNNLVSVLELLKERLGKQRVTELKELAESGQLSELASALLLEYYDPLYNRHVQKYEPYDLVVSGDDCALAAKQIADYIKVVV